MYLTWLADARLYEVLARIDADLAETTRPVGCRVCHGVLHRATIGSISINQYVEVPSHLTQGVMGPAVLSVIAAPDGWMLSRSRWSSVFAL